MGNDHSMHLENCSQEFQDEFSDFLETWSHAARSIRGNAGGANQEKAKQIDRNIRATLDQCWAMSREQYPVFERRFHGIKGRIIQDIGQLEQIAGTA